MFLQIDRLEIELEVMHNKCLYLTNDHRRMSQNQGKIITALKEAQEQSRLIQQMSLAQLKEDLKTHNQGIQTE